MKAMYALNQSPRMWSLRIENDFSEFNLYRLTAHFCVYDVFKGPGWVLLGTFLQDVFVFGKIMLLPEIYLGEVLLQYPVTSSRAPSPRLTSACKPG